MLERFENKTTINGWISSGNVAAIRFTINGVYDGREVINLCANNYLGLAHHPEVHAALCASVGELGLTTTSSRETTTSSHETTSTSCDTTAWSSAAPSCWPTRCPGSALRSRT